MHIKDFTGRGASVRGLCEAFLSGAPPHATLLLGAAGVGKRTLADALAQGLHCQGEPPRPCGECPACQRYAAGSHPDAYHVQDAKRIGVDEIRGLIAALQQAPYEGGWRSVVMPEANTMTAQAQNSLLKTLEEPPARTVFLLTAVSGAQLLPTIRSRCRIVQMPPFSQAEVEQMLANRGMEAARAKELAAMAQGSLGRAVRLDSDEGFWQLRGRLFAAVNAVHGPGDVLEALNALKEDKAEAGRACDLLESALREALSARLSGTDMAPQGWTSLSLPDARTLSDMIGRVMEMRRRLASNVPWQAVLERFLLEYAEDIHKWQS